MTNSNIIQTLESVLANSYAIAIKTQNYHWNVTGPNFKQLHLLFEEQYNEILVAIDNVAERIRTLGEKVDGNLSFYKENSKYKPGNQNLSDKEMIQDLINDNDLLSNDLADFIKIAQEGGDEGTADLYIQRLQIHQKASWMLKSSL
ncbi:MAG: DNA starvation/stationary phase protection protein [Rickettsiales bacterium]|jgi:starvation-inducible DNA-binding protein|nr:DNA starvation/stationary phase protection protein [Rickettsiales bacterium]|tara:strand:+ start:23996 stop:24433 length:438 start_codon:yes stop_codon:yes gene_type:complete